MTGLRVRNEDGVYQISESNRNLVLTRVLQIETTTSDSGVSDTYPYGAKSRVFVRVEGENPILAYKCTRSVVLVRRYFDNGRWVFHLFVLGPVGTAITCYVYDTCPTPAASGTGLVVWDASAKPIYASDYAPMKVRMIWDVPNPPGYNGDNLGEFNTQLPAGDFAAIPSVTAVRVIRTVSDRYVYLGGVRIDGSNKLWHQEQIPWRRISESPTKSVKEYRSRAWYIVVVDVAGV